MSDIMNTNVKTEYSIASSEANNAIKTCILAEPVKKKKKKKKESYKDMMNSITKSKPDKNKDDKKNIKMATGGGHFSKLDRI